MVVKMNENQINPIELSIKPYDNTQVTLFYEYSIGFFFEQEYSIGLGLV